MIKPQSIIRLLSQQMNYNQRVLQLDPQQSKLLDSLCFELAVNLPDQNSLSLLQILEMRKSSQINEEELKQLYVDWLESKNIFDLFTARQLRIFPKCQLLANQSLSSHIQIDSILGTLQLLNNLYNQLYLRRKRSEAAQNTLQEIEDLFQFLDANGNIHLGLSQLFFLAAAVLIVEGKVVPQSYDHFKPFFKQKNRQLCEIEGIVCLRCFKNHFLSKGNGYAKQILDQLKEIGQQLKKGDFKSRQQMVLPDILGEALFRWRSSARFNRLFESKKKRFEMYQRIFSQNAEIFFFNDQDQNILSQSYFYKKYSKSYIKSLQIQEELLSQFAEIVKSTLNQNLAAISKISGLRRQKSQNGFNSNMHNHQTQSIILQQPSNPLKAKHQSQKNMNTGISHNPSKFQNTSSSKQKTPNKTNKGNQTRRFNASSTYGNTVFQPLINKQFASAQKQALQNNLTPNKSSSSLYTLNIGHPNQVYRNSKKQGLEKDSVYQKLFFFRNKRVQSFDIVMKRLRGK